jgi:large subunit ribosomal protein L3
MIMSLGLIGRKVGMTRIFTEEGASIPVTVLEVKPNRVTQIKTIQTDGYNGLQVAFGERRPSRVTKALAGHYAKSGVAAGSGIQEFSVESDALSTFSAGQDIKVDIFTAGQIVDVTGTSLGKGFAGAIKRHHFSSNRASHGNSKAHKKPGSTGMAQDPGRIFPGKRMPGHLGAVQVTTQNLEIIRVDVERNLLLIKGAIPGSKGGDVVVRPAIKVKVKKSQGGSK